MPFFHIVILALVQGLTEFLPVSSSGHLIIVHAALDNGDATDTLTLDVAVHVGTLIAVLGYFRHDVVNMAKGLARLGRTGIKNNPDGALVIHVILGSLPVIAAGYLMHKFQPPWFRTLEITAFCTIGFGILLWISDKWPTKRNLKSLTIKNALFIGCMQVLALIPGTSRSGITMTAARFLGFSRTESARFSLFLAIVAISGAGTLSGISLVQSGDISLTISALFAVGLAAVSGWLAIALMMRWLENASFTPFAIYRILLGGALLVLIYSGVLG